MLIRKATPHDESQILEVAKPQISVAFHWPPEVLRSELLTTECWLLEDNHRVLAFLCLRDLVDAWEISVVGTHPQFQRRGLMEQLLKSVIADRGSQRQLWLEVHEHNLKACNLYEKLGFKKSGTRGGYYKDGSAAVLYTRTP